MMPTAAIIAQREGAKMDDGDDLVRRPKGGDLGRIKAVREIQNENVEEHEREPRRAKITETDPHHHTIRRADAYMDIRVLAATKRDLPEMHWLVFLAMEFGFVRDARGILRIHTGKREPVERDLTFEEVAAHYGLSRGTVERYDRTARRVFRQHRAQADYIERSYGPDWQKE
jgi:hypothetical protein